MAEVTTVMGIIKEIQDTRSQSSASQKDEVRVARALMNDTNFAVDIYSKNGVEGQYCPAKSLREGLSEQLRKITKVSAEEASALANNYEYSKNDAAIQVAFSKEFVNTYMYTGRKLPLGTREMTDVSLIQKDIPEGERTYPCKVGVNEDGTDRYGKSTVKVPAHKSIKVISNCPSHIKK